MNKYKRFLGTFVSVVIVSLLVFGTQVFAAPKRETVKLLTNMAPTVRSASRSGKYASVYARCYSVYPYAGGKDTYKRIRVTVYSTDHRQITGTVVLNEENTANTLIRFYDVPLNFYTINFYFTGNSNTAPAAGAEVMYDAR